MFFSLLIVTSQKWNWQHLSLLSPPCHQASCELPGVSLSGSTDAMASLTAATVACRGCVILLITVVSEGPLETKAHSARCSVAARLAAQPATALSSSVMAGVATSECLQCCRRGAESFGAGPRCTLSTGNQCPRGCRRFPLLRWLVLKGVSWQSARLLRTSQSWRASVSCGLYCAERASNSDCNMLPTVGGCWLLERVAKPLEGGPCLVTGIRAAFGLQQLGPLPCRTLLFGSLQVTGAGPEIESSWHSCFRCVPVAS